MRHERSECRIARRCPLSAQVEYQERGTTRPRSRPAVLRRSSAARTRSCPLRCYWRRTSEAVASITTDANEAPSALADGAEARIAEARGSEKERASAAKTAVSAISEGDSSFLADRRTRVCGKQSTTNQTYPVAAGKAVGTSQKYERTQRLVPKSVCLQAVPTVGITVGIPVGIAVGTLPGG